MHELVRVSKAKQNNKQQTPGNLEPLVARAWPHQNQQNLSNIGWLATNARPQACACVSVSDQTIQINETIVKKNE